MSTLKRNLICSVVYVAMMGCSTYSVFGADLPMSGITYKLPVNSVHGCSLVQYKSIGNYVPVVTSGGYYALSSKNIYRCIYSLSPDSVYIDYIDHQSLGSNILRSGAQPHIMVFGKPGPYGGDTRISFRMFSGQRPYAGSTEEFYSGYAAVFNKNPYKTGSVYGAQIIASGDKAGVKVWRGSYENYKDGKSIPLVQTLLTPWWLHPLPLPRNMMRPNGKQYSYMNLCIVQVEQGSEQALCIRVQPNTPPSPPPKPKPKPHPIPSGPVIADLSLSAVSGDAQHTVAVYPNGSGSAIASHTMTATNTPETSWYKVEQPEGYQNPGSGILLSQYNIGFVDGALKDKLVKYYNCTVTLTAPGGQVIKQSNWDYGALTVNKNLHAGYFSNRQATINVALSCTPNTAGRKAGYTDTIIGHKTITFFNLDHF